MIPLGTSFDVAGWFARDADVFERVGRVLLDDEAEHPVPNRLLYARDPFDLVGSRVSEALKGAVQKAGAAVGSRENVIVSPEGLASWSETFRVHQAAEVWGNHGAWVGSVIPKFDHGFC